MLRDIRNNYHRFHLQEEDLNTSPIGQFRSWMKEALENKVSEPTAMVLSTSVNDQPDSRIVLLKEITEIGFVFFTNYNSAKGQQINSNPNVSLNFFWHEMERQVRIKGLIEKLSREASETYFKSRPRDSQLGACASNQSQEIESREKLEKQFQEKEETFQDDEIKMPEEWGGYLVKPFEMEFWQGRPNRMHDRIRYRWNEKEWVIKRLQP